MPHALKLLRFDIPSFLSMIVNDKKLSLPVFTLKSLPLRDCRCHNLRKGRSHYLTLFTSSGGYTVPEITSVLTPGLIPQAPVVVSCV